MEAINLLQTTYLNPGIVSAESSLCVTIHWGSSCVFWFVNQSYRIELAPLIQLRSRIINEKKMLFLVINLCFLFACIFNSGCVALAFLFLCICVLFVFWQIHFHFVLLLCMLIGFLIFRSSLMFFYSISIVSVSLNVSLLFLHWFACRCCLFLVCDLCSV